MVQQYPILFCIVVGITRSGVEFRSWISSWPGFFGIFASQTNKPTQVLLRQHTPKGTYPRPSTNPLWFGIPFLLGFVPEAPGISWVLLDRWIFPWPKGIEIKFFTCGIFFGLGWSTSMISQQTDWEGIRRPTLPKTNMASWKIHYLLKMEIQIFIHGDKFPATCGPC